MPKITIKDLATELNIDTAELKAFLNENGFEAKTASKQLDEETENMARKKFSKGVKAESAQEEKAEKKPAAKKAPAKKEEAPVKEKAVKEEPVKEEPAKEETAKEESEKESDVPAKDAEAPAKQQRQGRPQQGGRAGGEAKMFPVRILGVDGRPNPGRFVGPDNRPIGGKFVDANGNPVPVRLIGPDGRPVPEKLPGPDGRTFVPKFVGADGRPASVKFIGPDGRPAQVKFIGPDGKPMAVRFIGPDGRPVPVRLMTAREAQNAKQQMQQGTRMQGRTQGQSLRPDERPATKQKPAGTNERQEGNRKNTENIEPVQETKTPDAVSVREAFAKALGTKEKKKAVPQVEKTSQEKEQEAPARPVETIDNIIVPEIRISGNVYEDMKKNEAAKQAAQAEEQHEAKPVERRDGQGRDGKTQGYNRDGQPRDGRSQGGFNRDGQGRDGRPQGGFNRDGQGRDGRPQGGFNRDGQGRDGRPQGGFNRDGQGRDGRPQGGFNRDGQQGGFRRDAKPGFAKDGGFNKDADQAPRFGNDRRTQKPSSKGSMGVDISSDISRNKRADNIKNKGRDKDDKNRRFDIDGETPVRNKKDPNRKGAFQKPVAPVKVEEDPDEIRTIQIPETITLKELADKVRQTPSAIIKKLLLEQKKMVTLNEEFTFEEAEEIALGFNCIAEKEVPVDIVEELMRDIEDDPETLVKRPPVVCVMGHVDHGKTSLLDAVRKTNVQAREAGGITQHIGAYVVEINGEKITFLDTPGHEAFTSMRMRGAKSTDIAILVVAADDGVMPQTVEAINHAKAANIPIIVAVNKIDKPGANVDKVKQELTEHALVAEDWGGDTVFVPVSAKTGEGIPQLLEMVLLTAEVAELKANPDRMARGIVIEAELDKGRGPVATVLVQKGTLKVGEMISVGAAHGKVRAMINDHGKQVKEAKPSMPVEILGLDGVPGAGDVFMAVKDEKEARVISDAFITQGKERLIADTKAKLSLDGLFSQIKAGDIKDLNLIVKADVQGSVEAVKQSLLKLSNEEVAVRIIHGAVGNINESDVNLAAASNAIIIGFNVKPDNTAKDIAEREKVDIKLYRVIYQAIQDVEAAMKGMLKPIFEEKVIGHAEIRMIFKASQVGLIAGSYVTDGKIVRGCSIRIRRGDDLIWEGQLASLKRFKDDVKEVAEKYECGLVFEKFSDFQELDTVEAYVMEEVPR